MRNLSLFQNWQKGSKKKKTQNQQFRQLLGFFIQDFTLFYLPHSYQPINPQLNPMNCYFVLLGQQKNKNL
jgi:hypothetical protein